MTPDELLAIMNYLRERISLESDVAEKPIMITFATPTEEEMLAAGLNAEGVKRILRVPWWQEMVADIEETPDMCDPDEPPKQVLAYARDVVSEYIRKRFPLNPK
jgi:hypothetical protein